MRMSLLTRGPSGGMGEKKGKPMATLSAKLIVQCQVALGLTQKELGDLVGKTKRTIQRWQDHGAPLLPEEARALANALRPVRPDLAEEVLALGVRPGAAQPPIPATAEAIDAILGAAADAANGTPPKAIRAAVAAAFAEARDQGVEVLAVVAGLDAGGSPSDRGT